jgi:MFS family permease
MSGVNALVYYIPFLLETTMGLPRSTSLWVSGLNGVTFFLASLYPVFFLDRWGRKKPFIIASASCCINMMMVAILLSLNKQSTNYAAIGKLFVPCFKCWELIRSTVFFFTYIAVYGIAFMGTPFMYTPELLPLRLRAKGSAVATSFSWLSTFVVKILGP